LQKTVYDIAKAKASLKSKNSNYELIEAFLFSLGAKEGAKKSKVKKRSGRPANLSTVRNYAL